MNLEPRVGCCEGGGGRARRCSVGVLPKGAVQTSPVGPPLLSPQGADSESFLTQLLTPYRCRIDDNSEGPLTDKKSGVPGALTAPTPEMSCLRPPAAACWAPVAAVLVRFPRLRRGPLYSGSRGLTACGGLACR